MKMRTRERKLEEERQSWAIFPNRFPKRKTWSLDDPYTWHQEDDKEDEDR